MSDLTDRIAAEHTPTLEERNQGNLMIPRCACGEYTARYQSHAAHVAQVTEQEVLRKASEDYVNRAAETYWRNDSPFHVDARYWAQHAGEWLLARADENCHHRWENEEFCQQCYQPRSKELQA